MLRDPRQIRDLVLPGVMDADFGSADVDVEITTNGNLVIRACAPVDRMTHKVTLLDAQEMRDDDWRALVNQRLAEASTLIKQNHANAAPHQSTPRGLRCK